MSTKLNSIAVLIDADNASPKNIGHILKKIEEKLGVIRCKKLFGDWSGLYFSSLFYAEKDYRFKLKTEL